ncbi:MAG TPA: nuclear transport factor 2 family protein [Alphaproteobacteria bacterium]|nr:nuclear transport factor 2 family protein [Alphaproteobacteria bacterium]
MPPRNVDGRALAEQWIAAWNSRDLDRIMEHYAVDVEFEANTVVRRWHKEDGKLVGAAALREHFRLGLELSPGLRFDLEEVFTLPSGYAVLYRRDNGNRVIDVVELDRDGKARRVKAFYASAQK